MYFFIFILCLIEIPASKRRSPASYLGVHCFHCLPRSPKRDARLIWVNLPPVTLEHHEFKNV